MESLVLELQRDAADGTTPLPDVLRKAWMVATKLKLDEIDTWIQYELYGYPNDVVVPDYRIMYGDVRAYNHMNGILMPVRSEDPDEQNKLSRVEIRQSIGSLHQVVTGGGDWLEIPFSEHQMARFRNKADMPEWMHPFRQFAKSQMASIFDAVRNRILDWTLRLESADILGEGMTFSLQEKDKAATMPTITIGSVENFQGVIGTVKNSTLHIDNLHDVDNALESQGFNAEERAEIQQLVAEHKAARPEDKISIAKRGMQWIAEYTDKLGPILEPLFRGYFGVG